MEFDEVIKRRTSVKKFFSKKPEIDKIIIAIDSANLAPSAGNLQLLKYIIVDDKKIIEKIADACQQDFIKQAPYLVVVCSDIRQLKRLYDARAETYSKHNAGAAVENFLLKITDLGLACCWVGAFSEPLIKDVLKIPEKNKIEVVLPVGYGEELKQRYKHNLTNKIFYNFWENKHMPFNKVRREDF